MNEDAFLHNSSFILSNLLSGNKNKNMDGLNYSIIKINKPKCPRGGELLSSAIIAISY